MIHVAAFDIDHPFEPLQDNGTNHYNIALKILGKQEGSARLTIASPLIELPSDPALTQLDGTEVPYADKLQ